jgi:hypothetical protein
VGKLDQPLFQAHSERRAANRKQARAVTLPLCLQPSALNSAIRSHNSTLR